MKSSVPDCLPDQRRDLRTRTLDCLDALLDACPQSGPDALDVDVDHAALCVVLADASALLYEAERRLP